MHKALLTPLTETESKMADIIEQEICAVINEKKFFSSIGNMFASSFSVIGELMQNSRRAGASFVAFDFEPVDKNLRIEDDGEGVADFSKLLHLCSSGWDDQTQISENPFGMGFFSIFPACDSVTIRSNGMIVSVSLEDIQAKRTMRVVKDVNPITKGTVLMMHGIKGVLAEKASNFDVKTGVDGYRLAEKIKLYAMGFPIDVSLNGVVQERPHALQFIDTTTTPIGEVHNGHIHAKKGSDKLTVSASRISLYLQGLPIEIANNQFSAYVVHLDSHVFTPQMPDRFRIQDGYEAVETIIDSIKQMAKEFLCSQKKEIDPECFLSEYASECKFFDVLYLLNDIPFVRSDFFRRVNMITCSTVDKWDDDSFFRTENFSTEEIVSGEVKVWCDVPSDLEDSINAFVLQNIMKRKKIFEIMKDCVDEKHWIFNYAVSCDDMIVDLKSSKILESNTEYVGDYKVDICLVDEVVVTITSSVDDNFSLVETTTDDFFIQGKGSIGDDDCNGEATCFITKNCPTTGYPVRAFCNFTTEYDEFDSEWYDTMSTSWYDMVSSMRGATLAQLLQNNIQSQIESQLKFNNSQSGQIALIQVNEKYNEFRNKPKYLSADVVDLESSEIWANFAASVAKMEKSKITGKNLKKMFIEAIKFEANS